MRSMFFGLLTATVVALVIASGCSSSPKATCPPGDTCTATMAPVDSGPIYHRFDESGTEASTVSLVADGTSGKACTADSDCVGDSGAGVNKCSSDYQLTVAGVGVQLWASPVCIIPISSSGNCDPGTDPTQIQFCDGDPNDPNSPGVCMAFDPSAPMTGQGICFPKCTFGTDGSPATGCVGHDACGLVTYLLDTSNNVTGLGVCQSACQTNADCAALGTTYVCEPDIGDCTMAAVPRTKTPGTSCTTTDQMAGACFCATGSGTTGFCTGTCVVGATPSDCPSGWVCDTGEPQTLDFGTGSPTFPPLTKQTAGMLGVCSPTCTSADAGVAEAGTPAPETDGGAAPEAAAPTALAACPGTSTCVDETIVGPDCQP